jgi:hypothetical protein
MGVTRLDGLKNGEKRTLNLSAAMNPGENNAVVITTKDPQDGSAMLVISASAGN